MNTLYPLKFTPILKEKIWGGDKLGKELGKDISGLYNVGESWEISGVSSDESIVSNGFLKDNTLSELIEVYMGDLVGDKVFEKFGESFPLLIKFIDANKDLSIQVHPDDKVANERHQSYGKTEMWYVLNADEGSTLISGFSEELDKEAYLKKLAHGDLESSLAYHEVADGDVFFIPAGKVHSIGKGVLLAEIQQASDVTYRIHDFNRKDEAGNLRELHAEDALDVIDFSVQKDAHVKYSAKANQSVELVKCDYFKTNILELTKRVEKDFYGLDSFLIYMCVEGAVEFLYGEGKVELLSMGETILIPAELRTIGIKPIGKAKLIEVHL